MPRVAHWWNSAQQWLPLELTNYWAASEQESSSASRYRPVKGFDLFWLGHIIFSIKILSGSFSHQYDTRDAGLLNFLPKIEKSSSFHKEMPSKKNNTEKLLINLLINVLVPDRNYYLYEQANSSVVCLCGSLWQPATAFLTGAHAVDFTCAPWLCT